jgi:CheY-like chemotaxis protein
LLLALDRSAQPCLVVVDMVMPRMNGWEFIAIIKSDIRFSSIPVIIVSGTERPSEAAREHVIAGYFRETSRRGRVPGLRRRTDRASGSTFVIDESTIQDALVAARRLVEELRSRGLRDEAQTTPRCRRVHGVPCDTPRVT